MSEKVALILVDIQNDFLEGGSLQVPESLTILKPVNELIEYIKSKHGLIIATQDWHPKDHISFASNHPKKNVFDTVQIEVEGATLDQVLWPDHCVQNSSGAELSKALNAHHIDYIVKKGMNRQVDSYSAFADNNYCEVTELAKILYQHFIEQVIIVGLAADYCVKFTCLDAIKFGFKTILVKEGTKAVDSNNIESTFQYLQSKGVLVQSVFDIIHN
ncbi:hypothetical protein RMATCC62417_04076 [Rhizopus microsporus]|nr:hypothetical protein RMATCC62417_04076 [Rhizopus microsporus]